jgi:hypothetical protein
MFDEAYVHVRIVPAMKQPMEADVSGETAEALLFEGRKDPVAFLLEVEMGKCRSCRSCMSVFIDGMNYIYTTCTLDPLLIMAIQ